MPHPPRRSLAPWLFGLAAILAILSPFVFFGVWLAEGTLDGVLVAALAALADLVAATVAAVVAMVLAAQRGVRRVRTAVLGHPDGRAGRMAEFHAARWSVARERFAGLQREYAAFEADPRQVAARPALTDVSVPTTARFVEAYADAQFLLTDTEPTGPRREEFTGAVDRAVAAWHDAQRTADALAGSSPAGPAREGARSPGAPRAVEGRRSEYSDAADAVRRAASRGMKDLRGRMRA